MKTCAVTGLRYGHCKQWTTGAFCFYHQKVWDGLIRLQTYTFTARERMCTPRY